MGAVSRAQTLKFLPRLFTNVCGEVNEMTEILARSLHLKGGGAGGQFNSFVEISTDFSTEFL